MYLISIYLIIHRRYYTCKTKDYLVAELNLYNSKQNYTANVFSHLKLFHNHISWVFDNNLRTFFVISR